MAMAHRVRVGIGGWDYDPWRETFYPEKLAKTRQLQYASRQLTAIEVNGTYYRTQSPSTYAKWRDETPEGFVFSMKALRYTTNRRVLAEAGESVGKFLASGITELGDKLGPIVWQLAPTKKFDADDLGAFFKLLPAKQDGVALRHVLDARHESFMCAEYLALARKHGVATVYTDSDEYPSFADVTGDFIYARLMRSQAGVATGYAKKDLKTWAARAKAWAQGGEPGDLTRVGETGKKAKAREVYLYFISAAKERNPAAARALLAELGQTPPEADKNPRP
ncbi:MAG TPA: DUF72 domain-containing protein [Burkholderiales bacterium]|nr:DUF72 domain-containing protein [Burkholderiales bacterium]